MRNFACNMENSIITRLMAESLKREIREELSTEISVDEFLCTVEYD